jgi:hypothetical protein
LFSRSIAALRFGTSGAGRRMLHAFAAAVVLPVLLPLRVGRAVFAKRRYRREFILALPLILGFTLCGIAGEVMGCLFGDGGSLQRVR